VHAAPVIEVVEIVEVLISQRLGLEELHPLPLYQHVVILGPNLPLQPCQTLHQLRGACTALPLSAVTLFSQGRGGARQVSLIPQQHDGVGSHLFVLPIGNAACIATNADMQHCHQTHTRALCLTSPLVGALP